MARISPALVADITDFCVVDVEGCLNHRAEIITHHLDLGVALQQRLELWRRTASPKQRAHYRRRTECDGRWVKFSTLIELSEYAKIVGRCTAQDLRKVNKLRNAYAHDRSRVDLNCDSEGMALVHDTYLYKSNADLFTAIQTNRAQNTALAIFAKLREMVLASVIE